MQDNLKVEQPEELNGLQNKAQNSKTVCVGQLHEHSFLSENFVNEEKFYQDIDIIDEGLKV